MPEQKKCEYCDNDAIGFQGFGCCAAFVCADHAESSLLELKPGQRKISGECVFERFG
jgi:hypothetical protein